MRNTTISVSYEEKDLLDSACEEIYNTTEVPHGAVIEELCRRVIDEKE